MDSAKNNDKTADAGCMDSIEGQAMHPCDRRAAGAPALPDADDNTDHSGEEEPIGDGRGGPHESSEEKSLGSSQASYIYNSGDEDSSSAANTDDERDYFGDSTASAESEDSGVAWVDSDEDAELREDYQSTAPWLATAGLAKTIQKRTRKISFKLTRNALSCKHRIKLFRAFDDLKVAVDTFNVIYLFSSPEDFKAYKIDYFRITGFVRLGDRLLFSSSSSSVIKQLSRDGKVTDINKRTGPVRAMCASNGLYVASTKLFRFDANLNLKNVFASAFVSVCANRRHVVGLKENGDIFVFDPLLHLQKKYALPGKFQFKDIFCTEDYYFLATEDGVCVLDEQFAETKELRNTKSMPTGLACNKDFVVYCAEHQNGLRILKDGLVSYDRFPFSKVWISPVACMDVLGDEVFLCHQRYVTILRLAYDYQ